MENIINDQLDSMDLSELEELMGAAGGSNIFDSMSFGEIISGMISGDPMFNISTVVNNLAGLFLNEIYGAVLLGLQVAAICIVIGLMKNMSNNFGDSTVSGLGAMICSCSVIALCLMNFVEVYQLCEKTVDNIAMSMQALLPVLAPLLIAMGNPASGGVLDPVILGAITVFTTILQRYVLPAVFLSCVFLLVNSLSEQDYVKKLALFLRNFALFIVGLCVTLFSGLTAIQGVMTKTADGMLLKTARYSIDNFVPIVGGFAADSIDMVLSCTGVIKNAVGAVGVIVIISILAVPLLKMLAIAVIYKITAIIIEPIGNKTISDCINEVGNTIVTLSVMLFLAALMCLVFLTIIISIGVGG